VTRKALLGFDLGGTTVRAAIALEDGMPLVDAVEATRHDSATGMLDQMAAMAANLAGSASELTHGNVAVAGCGVGLAAAVAPVSGRLRSIHNLPGLAGIDLGRELARRLGVPVSVENDANLAALAEGRSGAAIGVSDYVFIAIGTGIGMGVVMKGRLRRGWRGMAGEVGFLPLGENPRTARARHSGAWELAAAGPAVRRRIARAVAAGSSTALSRSSSFADALEAAEAGDATAAGIVDAEAVLIALGVGAIAAISDPELVILGGGVGANPRLLEPVRRHVAPLSGVGLRIESSQLGERAPLLGALEAARSAAASARERVRRVRPE
jgi:predicted NBD/HSP70 family sugar kinase